MPDARHGLSHCTLCPRRCGADRFQAPGFCGMGAALRVNRHMLHHWEEPVLSGSKGSGTVFFSGCNLKCVYCQNFAISDQGLGRDLGVADAAALFLDLQAQGAHNLNLITATHFAPLAREAVLLAKSRGLSIPVVWNTSGYESVETLRLLDGVVDVYLPDLRYVDPQSAARYSAAPDYPEAARAAILEMHRQVGNLTFDADGLARRGLLVRLLVLPGDPGGVAESLAWIAEHIGPQAFVSLMGQYYPAHRAAEFPEIDRAVTQAEYDALLAVLEDLGFENGFAQDVGSSKEFTPEFGTGEG